MANGEARNPQFHNINFEKPNPGNSCEENFSQGKTSAEGSTSKRSGRPRKEKAQKEKADLPCKGTFRRTKMFSNKIFKAYEVQEKFRRSTLTPQDLV